MHFVLPRVLLGTFIFLLAVPGTVAGLVPYWLTGWEWGPSAARPAGLSLLGGAMMLAGLTCLLRCSFRFARDGLGTPAPMAPPRHLVVSGAYRHVRNPMYLSVLLTVAGQGLMLGNPQVLGYAAGLWLVFHAALIWYEEPRLARRFGEPYAHYCRQVRRWLPRLFPWDASGP